MIKFFYLEFRYLFIIFVSVKILFKINIIIFEDINFLFFYKFGIDFFFLEIKNV